MMKGEFIDIVQTAGIMVVAAVLTITAVRFIRAIDLGAQRIKEALVAQRETHQTIERLWKRIEGVERRLEASHEDSFIDH